MKRTTLLFAVMLIVTVVMGKNEKYYQKMEEALGSRNQAESLKRRFLSYFLREDTLTYSIVVQPTHGSLDESLLPAVTYTPDEDYAGV